MYTYIVQLKAQHLPSGLWVKYCIGGTEYPGESVEESVRFPLTVEAS